MTSLLVRCGLISVVLCGSASAQFAQYLGPTPYSSAADSLLLIPAGRIFEIEDFEDDVMLSGVSISGGVRLAPGDLTDSVDSDDGAVDGLGRAGWSYLTSSGASAMEVRFDADVLGQFPTHAGLVWTDVGQVSSGNPGFGIVRFEAFDAAGVSLGEFGPFLLGDGAVDGATAEDRFLGIVNDSGISRFTISMDNSTDWEIDHVQYGIIPAPGAVTALMLASMVGLRRRR